VVLVLFGRGRVSEIMGDFGKGIKSFKEGMSEDTKSAPPSAAQVPPAQIPPATAAAPQETAAPQSTDQSAKN
jgi:sec-independent protein translocase protein TatA